MNLTRSENAGVSPLMGLTQHHQSNNIHELSGSTDHQKTKACTLFNFCSTLSFLQYNSSKPCNELVHLSLTNPAFWFFPCLIMGRDQWPLSTLEVWCFQTVLSEHTAKLHTASCSSINTFLDWLPHLYHYICYKINSTFEADIDWTVKKTIILNIVAHLSNACVH